MGLANAVQGATHRPQLITWTDGDGDAVNLTDATLSGRIVEADGDNGRAIAGDLDITDATGGEFSWTYAAADVATAGLFLVQFVATYGDATADKTLAESWEVKPAI